MFRKVALWMQYNSRTFRSLNLSWYYIYNLFLNVFITQQIVFYPVASFGNCLFTLLDFIKKMLNFNIQLNIKRYLCFYRWSKVKCRNILKIRGGINTLDFPRDPCVRSLNFSLQMPWIFSFQSISLELNLGAARAKFVTV